MTATPTQGLTRLIQRAQEPQPQHGEKEIAALLNYAKRQRRGDWQIYADCKRKLDRLSIPADQYQQAHRYLIDILRV